MEDPVISLEDMQDVILEEDRNKIHEMICSLCEKYHLKQGHVLRQFKDMLGEEEYYKRFLEEKENVEQKIHEEEIKKVVEENGNKIIENKESKEAEVKTEAKTENKEEKKIVHFEDLKFCKIKRGTKKPYEPNWPNKPYTWQEIQEHIHNEVNFGVLCGYEGLIIVDADTAEFRDAIIKLLPKTFTVKTGGDSGGIHLYYICPEVEKKIVLQVAKEDKHYGEVQSWGAQCVGPGSIHVKTARLYEIIEKNDGVITELDYETLLKVIKPYSQDIKDKENISIEELKKLHKEQSDKYGESDINTISIMSVINTAGFRKAANGEIFGANPWHGSRTGMNLWINPSKNLALCFRCNAGINIAQAIALNEGIIHTCSDKLTNDQFFRVLEIAYNKYGLKKPDIEYADNSWIKKVVNKLRISELASEFGLTKCIECSQELIFDDRHGKFSCNCGNHGNVVDLTERWIRKKKEEIKNEDKTEENKNEEVKQDG